MDSIDILDRFTTLFSEYFYEEILNAYEEEKAFELDYSKLEKLDSELADQLFENPEEVIELAEEAIKNIDLGEITDRKLRVRLINIPDTHTIKIRDIRSEHINKLIAINGIIKQASEVRPEVILATFECRACGNTISLPQDSDTLQKPYICDQCGNKRGFDLVSRKLRDTQRLEIEEIPENLEGSPQPRKIGVFIREDLVDPKFQRKIVPGSKVRIYGIVKDIPVKLESGKESKRRDLYMEGNNIEKIEKEFEDLEISKEEEQKIKELAKNPKIEEILVKSIAPSIYGYEDMKYAIALQLFGGVKKQRPDGVVTRGDIHILLIGDPGTAKSQLLKYVTRLAPRARYVVGKSTSGAGLCVSPNSLVLTNPGGIDTIQNTVENNFTNPEEYRPGIWKQDNIKTIKIQSMSNNLKIHSKHPESIWKLKAPEKIYKITLSSGKSIELTPNTKLFKIQNGITKWEKSKNLKPGDYIATPRRLIGGNKIPYTLELISSNPEIHNIESFVKELLRQISKKTTIRELARKLNINENNLYHSWVKKDSKGKINLDILKKLVKEAKIDKKYMYDKVETLSLYNGKSHKIPTRITKELIYITGLLIGDGDLRKTKTNTYSIRLSNSCRTLQNEFRKILKEQFSLNYDIQKATQKRPEATRTNSKILGEILLSLGMPISPKKDIFLSEHTLHLPNNYLSELIAGLYDSDGSIQIRNKGSNTIEFTTTLKTLAKQLQLILLRYEIHATLRTRKPSKNKKIHGKKQKYVLEIRGKSNILNFYKNIPLKHPEKSKKLKILAEQYKNKKENTNTDLIPGIQNILKELLKQNQISISKLNSNSNLSRTRLQNLLRKIKNKITKNKETYQYLLRLAHSDIFWEKIKSIEIYTPDYDYVYDLTVNNSHNFIVDGILVHNTATVVKDEFMRGWALEAGALVLANNGMAMIDELDKMGKEDRSAMHEVMEQQCYHPKTEILLSNGRKVEIGAFIDSLIENNKDLLLPNTKDCDVLELNMPLKIQTSNNNRIEEINIKRVSRHKPFKKMYKITYSNGREIIVTPNHPVYVFKEGITTIPAEKLKKGLLVPAPRKYKLKEEPQYLGNNLILDKKMAKFLGLFASEGHSYKNTKHRTHEIGISNTDTTLNREIHSILSSIFPNYNININHTLSPNSTLTLTTTRLNSKQIYNFMNSNFPELMTKSYKKRIPQKIFSSLPSIKKTFLEYYFKGDGFYDSERFGYITSSRKMAEDLQDLLLTLNIYSYIATEKRQNSKYYKVVISGNKNMKEFINIIKNDKRINKIIKLYKRSLNKNNDRDVIPNPIAKEINNILSQLKLNDGYFYKILKQNQNIHIKTANKYLNKIKSKLLKINLLLTKTQKNTILENLRSLRKISNTTIKELSKNLDTSESTIYNYEKNLNQEYISHLFYNVKTKISQINEIVNYIDNLINKDIRFLRIKDIKEIKSDTNYVYDITIEPTHNFISHGLILHNTVTVSKANVQATLNARATILAAANPKFGRFDPYENIGKQIDLPETLISRFDLIFPIRDKPDKKRDTELVRHILSSHENPNLKTPIIDEDLFRKYISYAKTHSKPKLTKAAQREIENFYVGLRSKYGEEDGSGVPITTRQLEAIIRLAEASAKIRLSDKVLKRDAQKAIELITDYLKKVGIDPETGKFDIDRLESGTTTSQRNKIKLLLKLIEEMQNITPDGIPINDLKAACENEGIEDVDELLRKLKSEGEIFEPKPGFIKRV